MSESSTGRGSGRGALLEMMRKNLETQSVSESSSRPSGVTSSDSDSPTQPYGRASLLKIGKMSPLTRPGSQSSTTTPSPVSSLSSRVVVGRGASLLKVAQKIELSKQVHKSSETSSPQSTSKETQNIEESVAAMSLNKSAISQQGKEGQPINIMSNYINIKISPGKGIFRYQVSFSPETDSPRIRSALLNQHLNILGKNKVFDGLTLFLPNKLPKDVTILKSLRLDGTEITLTIKFQSPLNPSNRVHFFNVLFNKVLRLLNMVRVNRNYYNANCSHRVEEHRLELWPGFVTAIDEVEGGLKLNIDVSHRVMRTETVRDFIKQIYDKNQKNFRDSVIREIMGMTVLTRYNNATYRIDGIDWDKNPTFRFDAKGKMISLVDYFNDHWNIKINDEMQPLIIHRAKKKLSRGDYEEQEILLVPELCYLTGMNDSLRSNFRTMRDLAQITQVKPEERRQTIRKFIDNIKNTPVAMELLDFWGVQLDEDLVKLAGRIMNPEQIYFGNNNILKQNEKADWSAFAVRNPMLRTPHMKHWAIFYIQKDERVVSEFIRKLIDVAKTMKMEIGEARRVVLKNDTSQQYVLEIRKHINPQLQMVVAVCPTNRNDRYAAIKKLCCVDSPIRSQVIITKTISQDNKLKSVAEKIALQMNCKLGGALWALKIIYDDVMIVGIDVYHAGIGGDKHSSIAAFVASMDTLLTSWYSKVCFQRAGQEIIDLLKSCFIVALNLYKQKHGKYPTRIIVYRDGVGDGELDTVAQYEVKQLKDAIKMMDPAYSPQLCVIVIQKRINSRIMALKGNRLDNPPPGTVVDSCVTRKIWYDFFLVPQTVRQGTITPTHYIVLVNEANFEADNIQKLSYKLCHLYYNWPGTVRVPAPCQYAHKLAYLVGQSIRSTPNELLAESLYYL